MIINSLSGLERLRGAVVIIDVFRASNTTIALLAARAQRVIPIADLEEARGLKKAHPDWLLAGERDGVPPPGFDLDNSPTKAAALAPAGKTVLHTTSAGTQAVARLAKAGAVFHGSFANASALARHLGQDPGRPVHLLPMGYRATEPAHEDSAFAEYLAALLRGDPPDFEKIRPGLLDCPGARRMKRLGLLADLEFCTTLDSHDLAPTVHYGELPYITA